MIPVSAITWQDQGLSSPRWQQILQEAITDPAILCHRLGLDEATLAGMQQATRLFPLRVPEPYLQRIQPGNPHDPLLLQVLPGGEETRTVPGFTPDPLAERDANPVPGLIHKYRSRVLLVTTSLCAIHCRYCFRRHFPYEANRNNRDAWQTALDYIRATPALNEVILSGGDPLALPDRQLAWLTREIGEIPHIRRLRLHTRLPIAIPQRITRECLAAIRHPALQTVVVLHSNHPNEIDPAVAEAIDQLRQSQLTPLNQSVLLAGINDDAETLAALSERLFAAGCLPYYLHAPDRVAGGHAFHVADEQAREIHQALQGLLPGFLVPRLVREIPGQPAKTWLV